MSDMQIAGEDQGSTTGHQTQAEIVAEMTRLFVKQDSLGEEIKDLKKTAKQIGYKPALLAKVAKAMANAKTTELLEQSEELQSIIEEVRS